MFAMHTVLSLNKDSGSGHFKEWENRLKIDYLIFDAESGKRLTKGYTTQVAVNIEAREMCFQSPQVLFDRLNAWSEFQPKRNA